MGFVFFMGKSIEHLNGFLKENSQGRYLGFDLPFLTFDILMGALP